MNHQRRNRIILAWVCFLGSISLLLANLVFNAGAGRVIPIAMLLLIFGILISASLKKETPNRDSSSRS